MISYQDLRERYAAVAKTLEALSPLVLDWAEKRKLLHPIRRSLRTYLGRAGAADESWSEEVLATLGMLSLFSRPPLLVRIAAEEATLERSLTGAE